MNIQTKNGEYQLMKYFYQRELDFIGEHDVLVCGGGPAGFAAAVQAGRMGCKVALVESEGILGGAMTSGGNPEVALFYNFEGRQIISGIGWELMMRLSQNGWAKIPDFHNDKLSHAGMGVNVNIPMAGHYMDKMCEEAKIKLFYHQSCVDVIVQAKRDSKEVESLIIASKSGLKYIRGKIIIDCTGDGDVAAFGGAQYEVGEELQPGTIRFYLTGYDINDIDAQQVAEAYQRAMDSGELKIGDLWAGRPEAAYNIFKSHGNNTTHVFPMDATDNESITKCEIVGRESIERLCTWMRKNVKGAENAEAVTVSPIVCARETRRIVGEKYITVEDYKSGKQYDDAVCYAFYPIDQHCSGENGKKPLIFEHLPKGVLPTIPLGAMIPQGFVNLLVAGRCISGDRLAQSAYRVKAPCMAMGQAAGAAAALALNYDNNVKKVEVDKLRNVLQEYGAIVPT